VTSVREPSDGESYQLRVFIDAAKGQNVADDFLVNLLKSKGWSERRIYAAFANHYERLLGTPVPERGARIEYAGDAFLYLLAFISLSAWAFAAGSIFDSLIDRWITSALDYPNTSAFRSQVAGQIATIIVAFPIFALVTRSITANVSRRTDLADSGVRKWLTYIALALTAMCLIGDGIWFLTAYFTGELTLRFVLKAVVLFVLAGSIFSYYLASVRHDPVNRQRDRVYGGERAAAVPVAAPRVGVPLLPKPTVVPDPCEAAKGKVTGSSLAQLRSAPPDHLAPRSHLALGGSLHHRRRRSRRLVYLPLAPSARVGRDAKTSTPRRLGSYRRLRARRRLA
jgi:hypothetical protein